MARRILASIAAVLVIAGCAGPGKEPTPTQTVGPQVATAPPSVAAGPTSFSPSPVPTRLDETLVLADGRKIKARCVGEGTPTILLEVGGSNDMADWGAPFVNILGTVTTTCLYSRAGGRGSSAAPDRPRTMAGVTSDAFEVLDLASAKAGVEGPYVFVGWSLGGAVALANALARPDQTVGIAILDSDRPSDFMKNCAADGRSVEDCQREFDLDIEAKFMETEIAQAAHPLDVPAVLVTAMEYEDCQDSPSATLSANLAGTTVVAVDCAGLATVIADHQVANWRVVLPEISQTRIQADHNGMVSSEGRRIADLILEIVEKARASS